MKFIGILMKLIDLLEGKKKQGTYAGVRFSKKTISDIKKFIKDNDISNPVKTEKLHTTLLYSRKHLPDYEPASEFEEFLIGKPTKFEKWPSQPDDDGNVAMCLVLKFDCEDLVKRHEFLMKQHGGTYDFDEYKPHITFSYDVGNLQCKNLPKFVENIEIVEEYGEDLNLDWAKNNSDMSE
jgi:hypothetical protein